MSKVWTSGTHAICVAGALRSWSIFNSVVARTVVLLGRRNYLVDVVSVVIRCLASLALATPEVAPESKIAKPSSSSLSIFDRL